jgi:hypothetical protein
VLRIFEVGHALEELAIRWLRLAGFELYTQKATGGQFGFAVAGGRIQGHVDGILAAGPSDLDLAYPALWECKTMNDKSWRDTVTQFMRRTSSSFVTTTWHTRPTLFYPQEFAPPPMR